MRWLFLFLFATTAFAQNQSSRNVHDGKKGITDASAAAAGVVGEVIRGATQRTGTSLTTATPANLTSITLTPGQWSICGAIGFKGGTGSSYTYWSASVSKTSAGEVTSSYSAYPTAGELLMFKTYPSTALGSADMNYTIPCYSYNFSGANVTLYLVANQMFSGGTMSGYGYLEATRVR